MLQFISTMSTKFHTDQACRTAHDLLDNRLSKKHYAHANSHTRTQIHTHLHTYTHAHKHMDAHASVQTHVHTCTIINH